MVADKKILFARRRLEEITGLDIVEDIKWDEETRRWYILVKIHISKPLNTSIMEETMWYIVLQDDYPEGEVNVYPAIVGGIENTFNSFPVLIILYSLAFPAVLFVILTASLIS